MATSSRIWPCPFFVKDKESYVSCLTRHCLLSMDDVREHLCLVHQIPIHCSVCYETFSTVRLRDEHMRSLECFHRPPVVFEGIADAQVRELNELGVAQCEKLRLQQKQWLKIWQIVFPNDDPPPSSFFFTKQELKVYGLRRFWSRAGEKIISDVLKQRGLQEWSIENEEQNLEVLYSIVSDRAADEVLGLQDGKEKPI